MSEKLPITVRGTRDTEMVLRRIQKLLDSLDEQTQLVVNGDGSVVVNGDGQLVVVGS